MIDAAIEQAAVNGRFEPWRVSRRVKGLEFQLWSVGGPSRQVDSPTAALFLLLLGLPEVAVICPDCDRRGSRHEEQHIRGSAEGWLVAGWSWWAPGLCWRRPCPTCTGDGQPLGRVQREPARLLLDAMPREIEEDHMVTAMLGPKPPPRAGDPTAREAITVLADQLQYHGDQRGTWVALWLAGPEAFAQVLGEVEAALVELAKCPGMAPGEYEGLDVHVPCVGGWLDERVIFAVGRSCPKCRAAHGLRVAVNSTPYQRAMVGLRLAESWIDDYLEPKGD